MRPNAHHGRSPLAKKTSDEHNVLSCIRPIGTEMLGSLALFVNLELAPYVIWSPLAKNIHLLRKHPPD